MVLTFKDYNSLLEIRFDIENELDIKIDDIWFVYSKKSISAKTIKPICITYNNTDDTNKAQKNLMISDLNALLGFIPCMVVDIKKAKENADPYGVITIKKVKFTNVFHKEASSNMSKYERAYNTFISGGFSESSEHSYEKDIIDFKNMGIEVKPSDGGLMFDDIVMTKNKALCEQEYNIKSKYKHLLFIDKNPTMGTLGKFYVYDNASTYPIEENLAILTKCKLCDARYIQNYFTDFKNVCPKCLTQSS